MPNAIPTVAQQTPSRIPQATPQAIPQAIPTAIPVKQEVPTAVPYIHPKLPQQVPVAIPVDQYATGQKTPVMHNIPQATPNAIPTVPQQTPPRIQEATHLDRPAEASHLDAPNHRQPDNAVHADNPFRHYNSITADGDEQLLSGSPAQDVTLAAAPVNHDASKMVDTVVGANDQVLDVKPVMVTANQPVASNPAVVDTSTPTTTVDATGKATTVVKTETIAHGAQTHTISAQAPTSTIMPTTVDINPNVPTAVPDAQPGQVPVKTPPITQSEPQPTVSKVADQTNKNTAAIYNQGHTNEKQDRTIANQGQTIASQGYAIKSQGRQIGSNTRSIQDLQAKTNKNENDIKDLRSDFERQAKELDGVAATAGAFAGLVDPYGVGKTNATVGLGYHGDAQAIAVGVGRRWNEQFTTKLGGAYDTGSESATLYAGAAYEW
nr:YadA C-terminal domain-containing protein [Vibrio splendidus]